MFSRGGTYGSMGVEFDKADFVVNNRTGATTTVGQVVAFDILATSEGGNEASEGNLQGREDFIFSNVITPDSAYHENYAPIAVCLEAVRDNQKMRVRVLGLVEAQVDGDGAGVAGDPLCVENALATPTVSLSYDGNNNGHAVRGILLEAVAAGPATAAIWLTGFACMGLANQA